MIASTYVVYYYFWREVWTLAPVNKMLEEAAVIRAYPEMGDVVEVKG
jgi:hypothetical protein